MDPTYRIDLDRQLATLNGPELKTVAGAALAECHDLQCQTEVLGMALDRAGKLVPVHVGEGGRLALSTGAGVTVGVLRGLFGEFWGRLLALVPAIGGLTLGALSKDASGKAAGYSVLQGVAAGEGALEARDGAEIVRAKMQAKVTTTRTTATPPAQQ